jgi:hypothetical protein
VLQDPPSTNGTRPRSQREQQLLALGYICAVTLPPIGLVIGIVLLTRNDHSLAKHGRWMIALGIVAIIVWILIFTSGVINTTDSDFS